MAYSLTTSELAAKVAIMQYNFTFELTNPDFGGAARSNNNQPVRELTGYANTDDVKHTHSNSMAATYETSMCSMVRTALASRIQGLVPSGFRVKLAGFTASKAGNDSDTNNSHPYRTASPSEANGLPVILPVTDKLIYENLCGVRGEAWFDISVLTPAGTWDACYINKANPVRVTWKPAFEFRRF